MPEQERETLRLLIVSESPGIETEGLGWAHTLGFPSVTFVRHENALGVATAVSFTHILVCEYSENPTRIRFGKGCGTWQILANFFDAEPQQKPRMARCGFDEHPSPDYVRIPFRVPDLADALGIPLKR